MEGHENKKEVDAPNVSPLGRNGTLIVSPSVERSKQPQLISILRAMRYSQAIAALGRDAYALVVYVAERCDEAFWRGPVPLFNGQLADALAFGSWRSLERARAVAVASGWLIYKQQETRLPGLYIVEIPSHCMAQRQMNERPHDDTAHHSAVNPTYHSAVNPTHPVLPITYNPKPKNTVVQSDSPKRKRQSTSRSESEPNKPANLDEVRAYFTEAGLRHITPEEYYDAQEARGWTTGRDHKPVQNWKANARQWERQAAQRAPQKPQASPTEATAKPLTGNRPPRHRDYGGVAS